MSAEEREPLLLNNQEAQQEENIAANEDEISFDNNSSTSAVWRGILIFTSTICICAGLGILFYWGIIPRMIQEAVNGSDGANLNHIHIQSLYPEMSLNVSVLVPLSDPKPLSANVNFGLLKIAKVDNLSLVRPIHTLAGFTLEPMTIAPYASQAWINSSLVVQDLDRAWVSWFVSQTVKYGIFEPTSKFSL